MAVSDSTKVNQFAGVWCLRDTHFGDDHLPQSAILCFFHLETDAFHER